MRPFIRIASGIAVLFLATHFASAVSTTVTPTTTLTAETSNNTSTADTFKTQPNGNIGATNVSKVDHHTLLYPGATTEIYTNIMFWFGQSNHMDVGYNSTDPAQVAAQVDDHVSRGIDGAIVDWYGTIHPFDDTGTQLMMRHAETLEGYPFKFAIMEDKGAIGPCAKTVGCDVNKQLISDLTYVYNTYQGSPAYLRLNGRPAVFFFGLDAFNINWDYVKANVPGNPVFIFQSGGGYTHAATGGAFSWVMINTSDPNDWKQSYLDSFYQTSLNYSTLHAFGTAYSGFNDTLASWSLNRIMNQNCGQTWLNTWNEVGKYYSSLRQLESLQIVTWNDYEEGTEVESGIENCVAVSATLAGDSIAWTLAGNENTVDHYTVFISLDGENLMSLMDASRGVRSIDLTQFDLAPGAYTLYVKAVGKPSMTNKMSGPVSYTVPDPGPVLNLSVSPTSGIAPLAVTANLSASSPGGAITATKIDFDDGTVANTAAASHTYSAPGTYTITATATDSMNVSASTTATVSVAANQPPLAYLSVSPASGLAPLTVTASTASSSDPDGKIAKSVIDFGDGSLVGATTATHTYGSPGSYTVKGTVTDGYGASATATAAISVLRPGFISVSVPAAGTSVSSPVHFVASATANSGSVITAMRIYVDSVSAYTVNTNSLDTYVSMNTGSHSIVVQAWDNTGFVYKTPFTINVVANQPPVAALSVSPTSTTSGTPVSASMAGTSDPDGLVTGYSINFGDGTVVSAMSGSHAYLEPGTYTIKATATDNAGASSTVTRSVSISYPSGVSVSLPVNGATVSSPVHFVASASSQYPITAMRIYVDGVSVYTTSGNRIDRYVTIGKGAHSIVVQAWDSTGAVFKASMTIRVIYSARSQL